MKTVLAIFILTLGLQPMPAQSCDGTSEAPRAQHAGHGGMSDMAHGDDAGMDCCASHGVDTAPECALSMDCHQCLASAPAVVLLVQGMIVRPFALAPESVDPGISHRTTSPLFRPPIS
jgi:hypothetical protein